jgi:hypothetical protein
MNPLRWAKAEVLHFAWKRGRYTPPDRRLLAEEIFPAILAGPENQRILSVGVAWYTKDYARLFVGRTFATLDLDPARAVFGGQPHVVGDLRDLERHFGEQESFDVILMNGVIGYGLDVADDVDRALRACAARLRKGGLLVLGLNEEKPTNVDPTTVAAAALFEPSSFGPWPTGRVVVPVPFRERTHTFLFWRRR